MDARERRLTAGSLPRSHLGKSSLPSFSRCVVVMDLHMPSLKGIEATRQISGQLTDRGARPACMAAKTESSSTMASTLAATS